MLADGDKAEVTKMVYWELVFTISTSVGGTFLVLTAEALKLMCLSSLPNLASGLFNASLDLKINPGVPCSFHFN